MNERDVFPFLCAVIGFAAGALVAVFLIRPESWSDARSILVLFTGGGYLIGLLLRGKSNDIP